MLIVANTLDPKRPFSRGSGLSRAVQHDDMASAEQDFKTRLPGSGVVMLHLKGREYRPVKFLTGTAIGMGQLAGYTGAVTWYAGKPPHVGWWVASQSFDLLSWRWWDGQAWSESFFRPWQRVGIIGPRRLAEGLTNGVGAWQFWSDAYPANARVPRVKP